MGEGEAGRIAGLERGEALGRMGKSIDEKGGGAARRNAVWFAVAGAGIATSFLVSSPYMAYAIYAFLLLVGIAHYSSIAWLTGLDCERVLSKSILQQGDVVDVDVTVSNRRGWPIPWIFLEDMFPPFCHRAGDNTRLAVLMPGRAVTMSYRLTCPKRGYHRIGPLVMESGDLFGLQKRFRTGVQQDYISVLPTIAYIDTFNISAKRPQGPIRTSNRIYEDPTRLAGLREYEAGDPMNRIHWKASARTGDLFTKIYEPSSVTGGTMILDLYEDNYVPEDREARMELAITVTASIAYLLQISGEQVGMITNGLDAAEEAQYEVEARASLSREDARESVVGELESDRIRPLKVATMRTPVQAQQIVENLARIVPGHGLDAVQLILEEFRGLPRDAALLPVVPYVSEDLALTLAEMKYAGFAVSVFFIRDRKGHEEAAALLAPHNIHVFHIREESDLHEIAPQRIGQ